METTERNKDAPKHVVGGPFAWLVQTTMERNPPHGWAVHFNGGEVPLYLHPAKLSQEQKAEILRLAHIYRHQLIAESVDKAREALSAYLDTL